VAGTVAAVAIAGAVALTGGAAMPVLIGAAQAGGMGALVSGAAAAAQGGSIADIAKAASDGFLWGAIGGAIAGGTAVMFNQAATTGSSLAGNYAVRQAVDVGTDTVLDTVQAVARGEDVNAKTIGRDLLTNTLMAGAQAAGGSGKNGIAGTQNNIKPDPDVAGSRSVFKTGSKGASGAKTEPYVPKDASGNPISLQKQRGKLGFILAICSQKYLAGLSSTALNDRERILGQFFQKKCGCRYSDNHKLIPRLPRKR